MGLLVGSRDGNALVLDLAERWLHNKLIQSEHDIGTAVVILSWALLLLSGLESERT